MAELTPRDQVERGIALAKECCAKYANEANWYALRAHLERMTHTLPGGAWNDDALPATQPSAVPAEDAAASPKPPSGPVGAWPEGLIERIKAAEQRIRDNHAPRRIPADPTDVDLVLAECRMLLEGKPAPFWIKPPPDCPPQAAEAATPELKKQWFDNSLIVESGGHPVAQPACNIGCDPGKCEADAHGVVCPLPAAQPAYVEGVTPIWEQIAAIGADAPAGAMQAAAEPAMPSDEALLHAAWHGGSHLYAIVDNCLPVETINSSVLALMRRAIALYREQQPAQPPAPAEQALRSALNCMLTFFGMDEDESSKSVFDQARRALELVGDRTEQDRTAEALRQALNKLPRYSFHLDSRGNVRRVHERSGNWIEWQQAHELFDPVAVDAARSAADDGHAPYCAGPLPEHGWDEAAAPKPLAQPEGEPASVTEAEWAALGRATAGLDRGRKLLANLQEKYGTDLSDSDDISTPATEAAPVDEAVRKAAQALMNSLDETGFHQLLWDRVEALRTALTNGGKHG